MSVKYTNETVSCSPSDINRIYISVNYLANRFTVTFFSDFMNKKDIVTGYDNWASKRRTYKLDTAVPRVYFDSDAIHVQNAAQPGFADEIGIYYKFRTDLARFKLIATFESEEELQHFFVDMVDEPFFADFNLSAENNFGYGRYELYTRN